MLSFFGCPSNQKSRSCFNIVESSAPAPALLDMVRKAAGGEAVLMCEERRSSLRLVRRLQLAMQRAGQGSIGQVQRSDEHAGKHGEKRVGVGSARHDTM